MSACSCWVGAVRPRACSLLRVRGIARPLPFANRRLRPPSPSPLGPPSILRLALPLSLTNLIGFCITLVTMSLVGRLGEYELSVAVGGWVGQGGVCGSCACRSLACLRPAPPPPPPPTHTQVLATSIFNVTGLSVMTGFSAVMETFCGQACGGVGGRLLWVVRGVRRGV